jgi:hypothetical protein
VADGPALALQAAVVSHLLSLPAVSDLVAARIYDEPGSGAEFPYIRLGRLDLAAFRTDGATDWDIMLTVEVHSRPVAGRVEATRIAGAIVAALEGAEAAAVPLVVPGYPLEWCQFEAQAVARQSDGASYVATLAFQVSLSGG